MIGKKHSNQSYNSKVCYRWFHVNFDTENRVQTLISRVHEGDNIDEKLIESSIESGIKDEKLMFSKLFYRSNINWSV